MVNDTVSMLKTNKMTYYNTTNSTGSDLSLHNFQASKQDDRIYQIFRVKSVSMTPFEVHKHYEKYFVSVPVTSIRRAMSTLTRDGRLEKTNDRKMEVYGKNNYKWKLA